ncbi:MAG: YbaN family protein [Desulfuromonadales bacterium]
MEKSDNIVLRWSLITVGLACTGLAILGIFLPLLPTVPLLLLAAACFARSSERFHGWLLQHPRLGPMIRGYLDGQGIPLRSKLYAIALLWLTIPISALFLTSLLWVQITLFAIGCGVTVYLLRLPLYSEDN